MGFISDRFDLEKQVTFYMSYHDNKTNQLIHFACIWPIFITGVMILAHTEPFCAQPALLAGLPYSQYMVMNYSLVMAALYMFWYIALDAMYVQTDASVFWSLCGPNVSVATGALTAVLVCVCCYYSAGTLGAAIIFAVYLFANYFEQAAPELYGVPAWQIAVPVHIAAWILQVGPVMLTND